MNGTLLAASDWEALFSFWPHLAALFNTVIACGASAHAILNKRDTRAAIAWVGLIWLTPFIGSLLYVWLGINRIRRKASRLRGDQTFELRREHQFVASDEEIREKLGENHHLRELVRSGEMLTHLPLLKGNGIEPLVGSEEAYPAMLEAIEQAESTINLATYIFNNDPTGQRFVAALGAAVKRGVEVRVLVDAIGARYKWPPITGPLRNVGVKVARFLPPLVPVWFAYANLRSHRKILVVDGRHGFTGGMNIRESVQPKRERVASIQDLHFRVEGPVVTHLQQVFADDWEFTTKESLSGDAWFPRLEPRGDILARGIEDGPDEGFDKLRMSYLSAIACAESHLKIMTPYFLPDASMITALNVAAMRGVQVDILLPERNNLATVQWASTALYWQVLEYGCRIWHTPPPFEHTKVMLVDGAWSLFGSGNWDPRSYRLNFEFNVESYDRALAEQLTKLVDSKLARSRQITLQEMDARPLPLKLRDGVARLLQPYL